MSTALLLIATGPRYWDFAENLIKSAKKFFVPHDVILFTDRQERFDVRHQITIPSAGYPAATLNRYHTFLDRKNLLDTYDSLWYSDVDMRFVAPVVEADISSSGITATLHPGFVVERLNPRVSTCGTPERRPTSACYIPRSEKNSYYCGGFNGGTSSSFLNMAEQCKSMIDADAAKGIVPVWNDESAINRFLWTNPPTRVLTPSFCYPESYKGQYGWVPEQFPPVLLALDKDLSSRWVRP